ncbi:MAG: hypothetical protein IPG08_10260 [Sphingobacteriaceae bacterium]|nr:hypothetical protein [Sphingobacteriaceae bacterium]
MQRGRRSNCIRNYRQVNQMAKAMNSIPYEVLTNISSRVKRIYTQE